MRTKLGYLVTVLMVLAMAQSVQAERPAGVTDAQKERLKALAMTTRARTEQARADLMRARKDMLDLYSNYRLDEHKLHGLRDRISRRQMELLNLHLENQTGLRQVLNQSQFQKFQGMLGKRMHGRGMGMFGHIDDTILDRFGRDGSLSDLGLSADQRRRMRGVLQDPDRKRVMDKLKRDCAQLVDVYSRYDLDKPAAKRLIDGIHQSQQQLLGITQKEQQEIRSVLSEDQFRKLWDATSRKCGPPHKARRPWAEEQT